MIYLSTTPLEDWRHQCSSLNQMLSQHHSENSRRLDLHLFVSLELIFMGKHHFLLHNVTLERVFYSLHIWKTN